MHTTDATEEMPSRRRLARIYGLLFLVLLGILPITGTIALRNVLVVVLLGMLGFAACSRRGKSIWGRSSATPTYPWILWAWGIFLILFPLWALDSTSALVNLKGQWGPSLLVWLLAWGLVFLLDKQGPKLWQLAVFGAANLALHLGMTLKVWREAGWLLSQFPWGYRAHEHMHGNLGYPATQTIVLFGVILIQAWRTQQLRTSGLSVVAIALSFMSIVIAFSRGAILYSVALIVFMSGCVWLLNRRPHRTSNATLLTTPPIRQPLNHKTILGILILALGIPGVMLYQSVRTDPRWHSMHTYMTSAWQIPNPIAVACNGNTPENRESFKKQFPSYNASQIEEIFSSLATEAHGDDMRILGQRIGLALVAQNPRGIDGSRTTYSRLMQDKCGHPPVMHLMHSHNGWIDTALALGWLGVLLFGMLMGYFAVWSWRVLRAAWHTPHVWPWAFALFLTSIFWIARGMFDAVYREHLLQMQAAVSGYLYLRTKLALGESQTPQGTQTS